MAGSAMAPRPARLVRDCNLSLVLGALRTGGPASRSELARILGLDRSTLTHLAGSLLEAGLIQESDEEPAGSRGGRRRRPLRISRERYGVLGVDIEVDHASWVLARLDGSIVDRGRVDRLSGIPVGPGRAGGPDGVPGGDSLRWIESSLQAVSDSVSTPDGDLLGVGVSLPGLVDHRTGTLTRSVSLRLDTVEVGSMWPGGPVSFIVDNDAKCCLWNAADGPDGLGNAVLCQVRLHRDGDGRFIESGAGIGLALAVGGSIHYGARGAAGELRGCDWAPGGTDQLGLRLDRIELEHGTDAALYELARVLARNLTVVLSVMDPDRLIVTGDIGIIGAHLQSALAESGESTLVRIADPDDYPPDSGAARMAISRILEVPLAGDVPGAEPGWRIITERCS